MFAASIQGEGVLAKSKSQSGLGTMQPDSPQESLSVGVGPVCQTSLPSGFSKWGPGYISHVWTGSLHTPTVQCVLLRVFLLINRDLYN